MRGTLELFTKAFMLTGQDTDPKDLDFSFYAHERVTLNADGDPVLREFYMQYDMQTGIFSDLAVKVTYTYQGPVRIEDIEWYFEDGEVGTTRQLIQVKQQS